VAHIIIEKSGLLGAEQLSEFLENRMAKVSWHNNDQTPQKDNGALVLDASLASASAVDAFVCSKEFADKAGGVSGITDVARKMKASRVMVISANSQKAFEMHSEMRGNLIFLNMAPSDATGEMLTSPQNFSLHMAVTRLLDSDHVAVSDTKSLELMALARRVSKTEVTVFINGPTGTGKEVLSKFIHNQSDRCDAPFVAVNCAAIPENMLEAILFGHEKGAFTGASTANKGIFRAADGGTLLLDEISEMPLGLQAKLLRALQERKVTPLGSQREIDVNVRVIATTNRHMIAEVREGRFREDLFYRLNVFPLATCNLSERKDDIVAISTILLIRHAVDEDSVPCLAQDAVSLLLAYGWPGNVRELENVLQRALVLCSDKCITAADIMVDGVVGEQLSSERLMKTEASQKLSA
jgi:two-component system, response regulator FlrC